MNIKNGDILESGADVICHQVNCIGVMGAGLAKQIADKYPDVYKTYKELVALSADPREMLGTIQLCPATESQTIANLFAQIKPSRKGVQTDYEALKKCFEIVKGQCAGKKVAIPYKIGCGLAGGDWRVVSQMIDDVFYDFNGSVEIWKI